MWKFYVYRSACDLQLNPVLNLLGTDCHSFVVMTQSEWVTPIILIESKAQTLNEVLSGYNELADEEIMSFNCQQIGFVMSVNLNFMSHVVVLQ